MRRAPLVLLVLLAGCGSVSVENRLPGATLENVRVVTDDGDVVWLGPRAALPGGVVQGTIPVSAEGERGRLVFELVVDGRRAELTRRDPVTLPDGGRARIVLAPDTAVRSSLRVTPP